MKVSNNLMYLALAIITIAGVQASPSHENVDSDNIGTRGVANS
jgi:hypothetical protein